MSKVSGQFLLHRATAAVALAITLFALPLEASNVELFRVERSTNRNYVRYDARIRGDGNLDPETPVTAYWILPSENGRREGLTWLEERLAYGFSVTPARDGYSVKLVAFDRRRVAVRRRATSWRAEATIAGKPAVLRKIWVQIKETVLGPHVEWVELSGVGAQGEVLAERIANP